MVQVLVRGTLLSKQQDEALMPPAGGLECLTFPVSILGHSGADAETCWPCAEQAWKWGAPRHPWTLAFQRAVSRVDSFSRMGSGMSSGVELWV